MGLYSTTSWPLSERRLGDVSHSKSGGIIIESRGDTIPQETIRKPVKCATHSPEKIAHGDDESNPYMSILAPAEFPLFIRPYSLCADISLCVGFPTGSRACHCIPFTLVRETHFHIGQDTIYWSSKPTPDGLGLSGSYNEPTAAKKAVNSSYLFQKRLLLQRLLLRQRLRLKTKPSPLLFHQIVLPPVSVVFSLLPSRR